jgi:hypothetical protein
VSEQEVIAARADRRYSSRKWRGFLLVLAIAVGMELANRLTPLLVEVLKWSLGLYCGFNVTQQAASWAAALFTTKKENAP